MKTPRVRRKKSSAEIPPKFKIPSISRGAGFIWGFLLWLIIITVTFFVFYIQILSFNINFLLQKSNILAGRIPFWFSVLITVFLFPLSLGLILFGTFLRIIQKK